MSTSPLPNVWHLRAVAEASSKSCYICYKPTTAVLITPDNKCCNTCQDFFYVCKSHLKDKGFASPLVDEKSEAEKQKEELDRQIQQIKKEYEEKQLKKERAKDKDKGKGKDDKTKDKAADDETSKAEKERDDKIKAIQASGGVTSGRIDHEHEEPRIFALQKNFYQMRVDRIRNITQQKMSQQRLAQKDFFPAVPKGDIG